MQLGVIQHNVSTQYRISTCMWHYKSCCR